MLLPRSLLPLLALPLALTAEPATPAKPSTPAKPNILVIIADDLGIGDVGFSGGKHFPTPNLDRIAREGASFSAGYLTAPVCSPTRAGYLSGRYQQRFGHEFNPSVGNVEQLGLPLSEKLLPARLREAGYRTAMVGKWHLGTAKDFQPNARGFDDFLGFLGGAREFHGDSRGPGRSLLRNGQPADAKGYLTDQFGDEGAAYIARQKGSDQPWFLYMAFNASHTPMHTTPAYLARVPASVPAPRRNIAAMTIALDDNIGKLLKALDDSGQAGRTLVAFTSDNGGAPASNASNLHLRGNKGNTFEGGVRTAMAVRWPGVAKPGSVLEAPTNTLDLTATYLAAATGSVPKELDGRDLAPALAGQANLDPNRPLYWRMGTNWAIRVGDWKLVGGKEGRGPREPGVSLLVNLKDDPSEKSDLSAKHPDKRKELEALFKAWEATLAKPLWKGGPGSGVGKEVGG